MKFLYFSDIHLYHKNPSSRIDDYSLASLKKLEEIVSIANENKVDYVFFGGDFLHKSTVPNEYTTMISKVLKNLNASFYMCLGNHDLRGHNVSTLNTTTVGVMASTGLVNILDTKIGETLKIDVDGHEVVFEGNGYTPNYDKEGNTNYQPKEIGDYNVLFTHGMLTPKRMMDAIEHTCIKDIDITANLTFCGHDHGGFGKLKYDGDTFINVGSIGRVDASEHMVNHKPCVILCKLLSDEDGDIYPKFKKIDLKSVMPFDEVFCKKEEVVNKFAQDLKSLEDVNADYDSLEDIARELTDDECVIASSFEYIEEATKESSKDEIIDYIKSNEEKIIESVHLVNFKSHADTKVEFTKGLNAIVGDNDVGKSTILKGIDWVVNDMPKGSGFIRTGKTSCEVTLSFTDGTYIKKKRNSSGSTYYVFDGEREEMFKGFSGRLPVELVNVHQMPLVRLWGKDNEKVSLNYASQIDSLFLVGTKATNRAQALGKLTNTDIIDKSIRDVSKDIKNLSTDISKKSKEIQAKENEIIDLVEKGKLLNELLEKAKVVDENVKCLETLKENIKLFIDKRRKYKLYLKKMKSIIALRAESEDISHLGLKTLKLISNIEQMAKIKDSVTLLELHSKEIKRADASILLKLSEFISLNHNLSICFGKIDNVSKLLKTHIDKDYSVAERIRLLLKGLIELNDIIANKEKMESNAKELCNKIHSIDKVIYELNEEIKDSVCPTCGKVIGD